MHFVDFIKLYYEEVILTHSLPAERIVLTPFSLQFFIDKYKIYIK